MTDILIIEDDAAVSRLVALVLTAEGYDIRTACDGFDGLEQLKRDQADLVVLDLAMPRLDGWTFVSIADRLGLRSRLMILSAFGAMKAADELHADGALSKPFDPEDLVREVGRILGAHWPKTRTGY